MAKNKKRKGTVTKVPQVSPKKYIQTKARHLPIYACYINEEWETSKLAQIFIARRHINGNVTFAGYLTDLLGLGVKDAMYNTNLPLFEFEELIDRTGESMVECDYVLAHNLIYGAVEFALDHDVKSHKDWEIARYVLEEDTDDIPLMDLEFGIGGVPAFILDDEEDEEYSWDEDEELEDEDFLEEEMARTAQKLVYTTIDLAYEKTFPFTPDDHYQRIKDAHRQLIIREEPENEMDEEEADALEFLYYRLHELQESGGKAGIKAFRKQISDNINLYPNQPIFRNYMANSYFVVGDVVEGAKQFEQCVRDFPDYLLGRLFYAFQLTQNGQYEQAWDLIEGKSELQELLPHRKSFHPQEVYVFYAVVILCYLIGENNLEKTFPYYELILDSEDDPLRWISVTKAVDAVSRTKVDALESKYNKVIAEIVDELGVIPDINTD
ncbi:hypothetical protein LZF95_21460 [Algoriphagus sp. AGSA1]|uniref:tetratricopeptide repeat protein n=1 Tax=Algoriphagus sp. AGSA1 TaxID=2907213 RepID=UPI001F17DD6D|nr:hypothetical protein [Algoriphagus sp. AGSA1]MCE7057263.1 hypothetical protein [Algoriphagus sp. AGSA1]